MNYTTLPTPKTEGIKYAGSKLKMLAPILEMAQKTGARTVLDGFSGTTRVAQAFAQSGYNVMGGMRWTREWVREAEKTHREFLFLIEK